MRLSPLILLLVSLSSLQAAEIAVWQTFSQQLATPRDGQAEVRAALKLIDAKDPEAHNEAIREALESAKSKGHPCAYYVLGIRERDPEEKVALLREAFDRGILAAIYGLADALYRHGQGNEVDFPEALELFTRANQWPTKNSLFYLGRMYHLGHGTEVDFAKARDLYKRAVDLGSVRAANNLANLWADGDGGEANLPMALSYLNYASERGMAMASYNLAQKYRTRVDNAPDDTNALKYYQLAIEQAAEAGWTYAAAAYRVGWIYLYGKGVPKDTQKALTYLESAAEADFDRALFSLGWFYDSGQQGPPDHRTANGYYRKAAAHGHSQAMSNLAWNLWRLEGANAIDEAVPHFKGAIALGNHEAMCNFGYLNLWEKWPGADPAYGLKLTVQAAEAGNRQAIENLTYYYQGHDDLIEPVPEKAAYWHQRLHELQ